MGFGDGEVTPGKGQLTLIADGPVATRWKAFTSGNGGSQYCGPQSARDRQTLSVDRRHCGHRCENLKRSRSIPATIGVGENLNDGVDRREIPKLFHLNGLRNMKIGRGVESAHPMGL